MIPLLIGGALFIGGGLALSALLKNLKGSHVAVLGTTQTGKTTFLKFLETGEIKKDYVPTQSMEKTKKVEIEGVYFSVNDVGGTIEASKQDWLELIEESKYIIYFMNIDKLLSKNKKQKKVVEKDLSEIKKAIEKRNEKDAIKLFLVASHADKQELYHRNYSEFCAKVGKLPVILESIIKLGGSDNVKLIIGSLKNKTEAEKVVKNIFHNV